MKKPPPASAARLYPKVVEWSEPDQCFVGSAPPLLGRCCRGESEEAVLKQLSSLVAALLTQMDAADTPPPPGLAGKEFSGKFILRVRPELHQALALRASQSRQSLNAYTAELLEKALEPKQRSEDTLVRL